MPLGSYYFRHKMMFPILPNLRIFWISSISHFFLKSPCNSNLPISGIFGISPSFKYPYRLKLRMPQISNSSAFHVFALTDFLTSATYHDFPESSDLPNFPDLPHSEVFQSFEFSVVQGGSRFSPGTTIFPKLLKLPNLPNPRD